MIEAAGLSLDVVAYIAPQKLTRGQRPREERPVMHHIAIDVHKRESQICILAEGGKRSTSRTCQGSPAPSLPPSTPVNLTSVGSDWATLDSHPGAPTWSHPVERDRISFSFSPPRGILLGASTPGGDTRGRTRSSDDVRRAF